MHCIIVDEMPEESLLGFSPVINQQTLQTLIGAAPLATLSDPSGQVTLNNQFLDSLPRQLIFDLSAVNGYFLNKYSREIIPCMEYVIETALINLGRPQYIDGDMMQWMDDCLEDSIREYFGIADDVLFPPHAQTLYSSVLEDSIAFCYELCTFFNNLKIPMIDNAAVYTTGQFHEGLAVLILADREQLRENVEYDYGAAISNLGPGLF